MKRIAIAGFQHETNTFAGSQADLPDFEMDDSWPGLLSGEDAITVTRGMNLPIAGFVAACEADAGIELQPILWASAEPSGPVTDHAFETILGRITDQLRALMPLDGVYLDLHGAMITQTHADGEGEILSRVRASVGPDVPVVISLDMHCNVTRKMVALANAITIFRTYPHLDMSETGARCLPPLRAAMSGQKLYKVFHQLPYLIPMHAQFTGAPPMSDLYAQARDASTDGALLELAVGFTGGDMIDTGPSTLAQAENPQKAQAMADQLLRNALAAEAAFDCRLPDATTGIRTAMALPKGKPVVIADVQDNPGGGTSSDTVGLLRAFMAEGAQGVLMGLMHDPEAAAAAHAAGIGAVCTLGLGGHSGLPGEAPVMGRYRVEALSDGAVRYEGEMYGGGVAQIGPTAVLRPLDTTADLQIVVSTVRNQCLDLAYFRHIGLQPENARILCVKSTVHYRAAFDPIAQTALSVGATGALSCDLEQAGYRHIRPGLRLGPGKKAFSASSTSRLQQ